MTGDPTVVEVSTHVAGVLVGNEEFRGVEGGERRIGVERQFGFAHQREGRDRELAGVGPSIGAAGDDGTDGGVGCYAAVGDDELEARSADAGGTVPAEGSWLRHRRSTANNGDGGGRNGDGGGGNGDGGGGNGDRGGGNGDRGGRSGGGDGNGGASCYREGTAGLVALEVAEDVFEMVVARFAEVDDTSVLIGLEAA